MTIHARIKADGSHAIVEEINGKPEMDGSGANLIEDDGATSWFTWPDFELTADPAALRSP